MKVGVIFPQTECGTDVETIGGFVRDVEAMGFDHLFVADHVLGADPRFHSHPSLATYSHEAVVHEALTLMAYLAAITRRGHAPQMAPVNVVTIRIEEDGLFIRAEGPLLHFAISRS